MMKPRFTYTNTQIRRRSMSLIEIILAVTIVTIVLTFCVQLTLVLAREQRVGIVQSEVNLRADMIQDKLFDILRHVSYSNIVQFTSADKVPGQTSGKEVFYYRIVFRKDESSPNQELAYNTTTKQLTHRPDLSVSGNTVILSQGAQPMRFSTLDYVWFGCGMQPGGVPDNSIILVNFSVSDHGEARKSYRNITNSATWLTANRSFGIFIRNI